MTNTISAQEWLAVIKDEYLDGFVRDGGSSIKFVVPVKEALAPLIKTRLQEIGSVLDYLVVRVDSRDTRVHMPQEISSASPSRSIGGCWPAELCCGCPGMRGILPT